MLRHPRRDRFAPNFTPERERREAAFARDEKHDLNVQGDFPDFVESVKSPGIPVESDLKSRIEMIRQSIGNRIDVVHTAEAADAITRSSSCFSAFLQTRPEDADEPAFRSTVGQAGIPLGHDEDPWDAVGRWNAEILSTHRGNDPDVEQLRAQLLRTRLDQPETLIALVRKLGERSQEYRFRLRSLEETTPDGNVGIVPGNVGTQSQLRILSRNDVYEEVLARQQRMQIHSNRASVPLQEVLDQVLKEGLGNVLGENALSKAKGIFRDEESLLTLGSEAWTPDATLRTDEELCHEQRTYFEAINEQIVALKNLLCMKLQERAVNLRSAVDTQMRAGLARTMNMSPEQLVATRDAWDEVYGENFQRYTNTTLQDVLQPINDLQEQLDRAIALDPKKETFVGDAASLLTEFTLHNGQDVWEWALETAQSREQETQAWEDDFLPRYTELRTKIDRNPGLLQAIERITGDDAETLLATFDGFAEAIRSSDPSNAINRWDLRAATNHITQLLQLLSSDRQNLEVVAIPFINNAPTVSEFNTRFRNLTTEISSSRKTLDEVLPKIAQCSGCKVLGISGALRSFIARCDERCQKAEASFEIDNHSPNADLLKKRCSIATQIAVAKKELDELNTALKLIRSLSAPQYYEDPADERHGFYRNRDGQIHINRTFCRTPVQADIVYDHELGHAVLDILTEKTHTLLRGIEQQYAALGEIAAEQDEENGERSFQDLLDEASILWEVKKQRQELLEDGNSKYPPDGGEALYRRKLMEELYMQFATYRRKRDVITGYSLDRDLSFDACEKTLFRRIERGIASAAENQSDGSDFKADLRYEAAATRRNSHDIDEMEPDRPQQQSALQNEEGRSMSQRSDLQTSAADIRQIEHFMETFPGSRPQLEQPLNQAKSSYADLLKMFETGHNHLTNTDFKPEEDDDFKDNVTSLKKWLDGVIKNIKDYDAKNRDTTHAKSTGRRGLWLTLTDDIQWLSIMDYWTMTTEGWEDIKRLWKRRGENARGKVGKILTKWIGDRVPYAGQLKHEFHRRLQSSEQDAVGFWEKALENVDSYELTETIPNINNKDQLKAVMILLSKRGRLDWDDPELWKTLNRFSHLTMPIEQCKRDEILRERWLHKVITDIWSDKDLFRNWKTGNEHVFDSEREKYNGIADFYANNAELGKQLEFQLGTFVKARRSHSPIPQEVNPHTYESLLHYAITRGKMSMEEKIYYLVQGLAEGLLPFDRLAILNSQVSTKEFPFIDFFYGHNNTHHEIHAMAHRLLEANEKDLNNDDRFKPGLKTKLFLQFEVAKDETARQRVYKVLDRRGDEIDHEDIPLFVAFTTYGAMNNFLKPMGGQKQRITSEGIKNAYVGYSTLLKSHAMIAKKKMEEHRALSRDDAQYLASRIVAYLHFDNIVVRRATGGGPDRPNIESENLDEQMPSGGDYTARHFRNQLNGIVMRIVEAYGIRNLNSAEGTITMDQYLGKTGPGQREDTQLAKADQAKVFLASDDLLRQLQTAILADPAILTRILSEGGENLTNEGAEITYEKSRNILSQEHEHGGGHH